MKHTVFYVEKESCPELHEHILQHLPRMQHWYEWEGCELIYLPLHQMANIEWDSIRDYLSYQFPVLNKAEFSQVLSTLQEPAHMLVNRLLVQTHLKEADGKAFLIYTNDQQADRERPFEILASYLPGINTVKGFFQHGFQKLWRFNSPDFSEPRLFQELEQSVPGLKEQAHYCKLHLDFSRFDLIIPDEEEQGAVLPEEIRAHLDRMREIGDKSAMLDMLVYILNNLNPYFKADQASALKMIEKYWAEFAVAAHPSRLLINKHSKLFLTDFGNIEVKMGPLPKTLFLFYLRHPEGVAFKELADHQKELEEIYSRISNSSSLEKIKKSIADLVDPGENSVNEKCSMVKAAFLKSLDISVSKNYLITGPKGGLKKIALDPALITYDIPQLQGCED